MLFFIPRLLHAVPYPQTTEVKTLLLHAVLYPQTTACCSLSPDYCMLFFIPRLLHAVPYPQTTACCSLSPDYRSKDTSTACCSLSPDYCSKDTSTACCSLSPDYCMLFFIPRLLHAVLYPQTTAVKTLQPQMSDVCLHHGDSFLLALVSRCDTMKKEEQMNLPETLPLSSTLSNTGFQV